MAWSDKKLGICIAGAAIYTAGMIGPAIVHGQMGSPVNGERDVVLEPQDNIVPSLNLSERYDSNVYFIQGRNVEDYVTHASPQLRVLHKGQLVEAVAGGGATAEFYAKNPGLNYVGANALIDLKLDGVTNRLARGLRMQVTDTFTYTPQLPSFAAPTASGGQIPGDFVRGVQAQRANSFTNVGNVAGSYAMTSLLSVRAQYTHSLLQFGNAIASPGGVAQAALINTTSQTVTAGPEIKVTPIDTVALLYQYQHAEFDGTISSGYQTQGGTAGWIRLLTPTLTSNLIVGVAKLNQIDTQYIGQASLTWRVVDTEASISYSRAIAPNFYLTAAPLLSQVITLNASHRITQVLSISLNGNYAFNEAVPDSSVLQYKSYAITPNVAYQLNRSITASLSYTRSHYDQKASSQEVTFDRNIVLLQLFAEWK